MKKVLLVLWLSISTVLNVMSQTSGNYVFYDEIHDNVLYLYMNPTEYSALSDTGKATLVKGEAKKHQVQTVYVICAYEGELWLMKNGSMQKTDSWDKNTVSMLQGNKKVASGRSLEHPWFFNISGAFDTPKSSLITFTVSGYGRIGCYLLNGRWDLALNCLIGYNKIVSITDNINEDIFNGSIGIDTRVNILKGKAVNPFAGLVLSYASSNGESSFTIPVSVGMSIPILGKSCLDVCYQYNKVTKSAIIVGYTYMR